MKRLHKWERDPHKPPSTPLLPRRVRGEGFLLPSAWRENQEAARPYRHRHTFCLPGQEYDKSLKEIMGKQRDEQDTLFEE